MSASYRALKGQGSIAFKCVITMINWYMHTSMYFAASYAGRLTPLWNGMEHLESVGLLHAFQVFHSAPGPVCKPTPCVDTEFLFQLEFYLSISMFYLSPTCMHAWSCHIHTQHRVSPPPLPPTNHFSLSCHDHVVQVTLGGRAPSPDSGGPAMAVTRSWRWPDRAGSSPAPLRVSRVGMCGAIVCEGGAMVCEGGGMVCLLVCVCVSTVCGVCVCMCE